MKNTVLIAGRSLGLWKDHPGHSVASGWNVVATTRSPAAGILSLISAHGALSDARAGHFPTDHRISKISPMSSIKMPEEINHHRRRFFGAVAAAPTNRGMTIPAQIGHAAAATKVGMELRPTEVLIFGNPWAGTPLVQAAQAIGIDLPLKALVWQDAAGRTWPAYNDPKWLAGRHGTDVGADRILDAMTDALTAVAREATIPAMGAST